MDIKPTRPTLTQEADAALGQKSGSFSNPPSSLPQFVIRTMSGDLKNHPQSMPATAPASSVLPAPAAPKMPAPAVVAPQDLVRQKEAAKEEREQKEKTEREQRIKKEQEQKAAKETAEQQAKEAALAAKQKIADEKKASQQEISRLFEQAELKIVAQEFSAAAVDAQKIVDNANADWLTKWRASRLARKAQKEAAKEEREQKEKTEREQRIKKEQEQKAAKETAEQQAKEAALAAKQKEAPGVPLDLPVINEAPRPVASEAIGSAEASIAGLAEAKPTTKEPALFAETKPEPPKIPIPTPAAPIQKPTAPRGEQNELYTTAPKIAPPEKPATLMPEVPPGQEEVLDIKKVLLVGLSSVAILALIVGGFWFLLKSPARQLAQVSPTPAPSQTPASPSPAAAPPAIFETDAQKIFTLKDDQAKTDIREALLQMAATEEPAGNFIHILFKNSRGEFLSLDKIVLILGTDFFDLPTQTSAGNLKNQLAMAAASFFTYSQSQNQNSASPFNASLTNAGRIGLIITINSTSTEQLAKSLKDLEQLMINGLVVLLPDAKNNLPANPVFNDSSHGGAAIRYVNLPNSDLSLDYAILGDKLIFATSKESMFAIIDRLLSQANQPTQP